MKYKSILKQLSAEDQKRILKLCDEDTYNNVVEILARPRPEGFGIRTSYSALRRFYTEFRPEPDPDPSRKIASQALARSLRDCDDRNLLPAILSVLECRVLRGLQQGRSASEMRADISALVRVQRTLLARNQLGLDSRTTPLPNSTPVSSSELAPSTGPDLPTLLAELLGDLGDASNNNSLEPLKMPVKPQKPPQKNESSEQ